MIKRKGQKLGSILVPKPEPETKTPAKKAAPAKKAESVKTESKGGGD